MAAPPWIGAGPVNRRQESRRNSELIADLSLRENCVLMPFFLSEEEYKAAPYAVFRDIVREGVKVDAGASDLPPPRGSVGASGYSGHPALDRSPVLR